MRSPAPSRTARPESVGSKDFRSTARVIGVLYLAGMVIGIGGDIVVQSLLTAAQSALHDRGEQHAPGGRCAVLAGHGRR